MIHHDGKFGRTVHGSEQLQDLALGDIAGCDAGAWFGDEFAGQSIPLFQDVLVLNVSTMLLVLPLLLLLLLIMQLVLLKQLLVQ